MTENKTDKKRDKRAAALRENLRKRKLKAKETAVTNAKPVKQNTKDE